MLIFLLIPVLFLFILGLVIGSFLNVVIYRTLNEESFIEGRSRCDHCKHQIAWYDNIPLLSFLVLRGRCRYCKKPIAITHLAMELLTGALFVWWYLGGFFFFHFFQLSSHPFNFIQPLFWLLVGIFLLIILVTDATSFIIPDYAVGSLFVIALVYRIALVVSHVMQPKDFVFSLLGTLLITLFFFSLWFFTKGKGMGFGDVKYCLPMGLLLGWPMMVIGVFLAFIFGAAGGIIFMIWKKKDMKAIIPFGPYLVLGTVIALVFGDQLLHWYLGML